MCRDGCDLSKYLQLFSRKFNIEACAGLLGDAGPSRMTRYVHTLDQEGMPRALSRGLTSRSMYEGRLPSESELTFGRECGEDGRKR